MLTRRAGGAGLDRRGQEEKALGFTIKVFFSLCPLPLPLSPGCQSSPAPFALLASLAVDTLPYLLPPPTAL